MKPTRTIRYLYLLYALYGLGGFVYNLTLLLAFLIAPKIPLNVSPTNYSALFYAKEGVEILIYSAFLDYGVYGIIHREGRTKAAYYVPLWFLGIGGFALYLISGLSFFLCATPETTESSITTLLQAHFLNPVYLFSFAGAILLIRSYQDEDKGRHYLKKGYIGLSFLFPLFASDLTLFILDMINNRSTPDAIALGTLLFAFRLAIFILSYFSLSETDE
jgi:hypothetical protein